MEEQTEIDKEHAFQIVYDALKSTARSKGTAFYGELAELFELSGRSHEFHRILDSIDALENREGRPILSALVVRRDFRIPGNGFFEQAKTLGKYADSTDDTARASYWVEEVHRVWNYWANH